MRTFCHERFAVVTFPQSVLRAGSCSGGVVSDVEAQLWLGHTFEALGQRRLRSVDPTEDTPAWSGCARGARRAVQLVRRRRRSTAAASAVIFIDAGQPASSRYWSALRVKSR